MWKRIKSWFSSNDASERISTEGTEPEFKWYGPGDENPFGIRLLDVRAFTWNMLAITSNAKIAESFMVQRRSDGREYINVNFENPATVECDLKFPHNGDALEGIVYKSESMEVKWDIYIYDSVFLFVRSWTGKLQYRAFAAISSTDIRIRKIETSSEHVETAPQAVYFILGTHAMRRVLPHTIPRDVPEDAKQIAVLSFSMYGNLACYATYEDITQIDFRRPEADT